MSKYYLFLKREQELLDYKQELLRVMDSITCGTTPVYNELRSAKINLIESIPYNLLSALFVVSFTYVLSKTGVNEIVSFGITLVVRNFLSVLANYIFVVTKHQLRLKLCQRLGIEPSEKVIAAMESLEYQTV